MFVFVKAVRGSVAFLYQSSILGPGYTYPNSFVSANILMRLRNFALPHVSGHVAFRPSKRIRTRCVFDRPHGSATMRIRTNRPRSDTDLENLTSHAFHSRVITVHSTGYCKHESKLDRRNRRRKINHNRTLRLIHSTFLVTDVERSRINVARCFS